MFCNYQFEIAVPIVNVKKLVPNLVLEKHNAF